MQGVDVLPQLIIVYGTVHVRPVRTKDDKICLAQPKTLGKKSQFTKFCHSHQIFNLQLKIFNLVIVDTLKTVAKCQSHRLRYFHA